MSLQVASLRISEHTHSSIWRCQDKTTIPISKVQLDVGKICSFAHSFQSLQPVIDKVDARSALAHQGSLCDGPVCSTAAFSKCL